MLIRAVLAALVSVAAPALAEPENTNWPNYQEGDFIISNYKFVSGETLPQLKLHYRALGSAERNGAGEIVNGVLLLQGNTGTGANWLRPTLADELFKDGQSLDAGLWVWPAAHRLRVEAAPDHHVGALQTRGEHADTRLASAGRR